MQIPLRFVGWAVLAVSAVFGIALLIPSLGSARVHALRGEGSTRTSGSRPTLHAIPVVIELFTSEGCSDCPPADRLLSQLAQTQPVPGAEIIPLEEHVDYWDDEGWRDPFSSSLFTQRQKDYVYVFNAPTPYTPQMVVDGTTQFVGSDNRRALAAIAKAAQTPKANLQIERGSGANSGPQDVPLRVSLAALGGANPKHGADVLLAITEDNLASNVTRGENAGVQMNHRAVVRELRVLGRVNPDGAFSAEPDVRLSGRWKSENLHVVAFVQDRATKQILAASTLSLAEIAK